MQEKHVQMNQMNYPPKNYKPEKTICLKRNYLFEKELLLQKNYLFEKEKQSEPSTFMTLGSSR